MLNTAVDDEILRRNPCRIRGGGQAETPERPTASLAEAFAIAASIDRRYRLMVLLAAFGRLRFGELMTLRRSALAVSPSAGGGSAGLRVSRALAELNRGRQRLKGPNSTAGHRTVALPAAILPEIREHLERYAEKGPDGRLFTGTKRATPRRSSFNRVWKRALSASGASPALYLHDLRRTGGTLAALTGATLKEVMARVGHGSTRAAMIYQHATSERDQRIAEALNLMIEGPGRQRGCRVSRHRGLIWHNDNGRRSHDRERRPLLLVYPMERATGIEPA